MGGPPVSIRLMIWPASPRIRICGGLYLPRSASSTVSATGMWTATRSRCWISTSTSKVGGALRSSTDFWVPRRRASSSERVTVWIPPSRSLRVGLTSRLSRVMPWAVPTSWTPRSAMVRAAAASSSVPISSMTITWGMWFSTASIITACCLVGVWTCIRRERPIPGWGMSPSPPISLEVSTITTRFALVIAQHPGALAEHGGLADPGGCRAGGWSGPGPRCP